MQTKLEENICIKIEKELKTDIKSIPLHGKDDSSITLLSSLNCLERSKKRKKGSDHDEQKRKLLKKEEVVFFSYT